uniref:SH3 domain-containing protein n=1 Tax=Xiphophorus couchianus TaxID=32473 RepID=A0A3B5M5B1_9TELE
MENCLWIVFFMLFPDFNMGLLSDYKICGDPECESNRVQAVKNHQGKDCRFLNFRRGDTIFVYHKLTGKREDLWAGSIDKQFGYFPKDTVQEEEVFATMRKVLETQVTSVTDRILKKKLSLKVYDIAAGTLTSTESMVKEREDEGGNKDFVDATELLEDELKTSAIPEQQGGSPSSSWLRSSMTGWLGFAKEEQSGDSEQEVREDEKETKSEASLTSSVTGWLGIGGEDKPNNDEDSVKGREDTFTSTMTGWLGFGEEKKTVALENEENEETGHEKEPTEKFRSRRMSLDLEGSKLQEEEQEDMGTMGWLGSGLASRLGFGSSGQDSEEEDVEVKEEQPSTSWMETGIGGIFGLGGSNTGADGSKESGFEDGERTGTKVNDDGDWKKDRQDNDFEEETRKTYATETENEFYKDREEIHDSAESEVQTSEQTESTDPQGTDSESRGGFGLIENTFGFFSQKPTPEMPESTQSVHNFNTNEAEPSQPHPSITPELEFPTDSFYAEVTHTAFPTEQSQIISAENLPHSAHLVTKEPSKTKPLSKHYKNLLHHMNANDVVILEDLFGRHKLQFLDYILKGSEAATAEDDQSILLDIERLLQHNMETLVAPSMSITDAVSLLPDDMRPGPDLYGVPWEPVIFTGLVGLVTFLLFTSRCYRSVTIIFQLLFCLFFSYLNFILSTSQSDCIFFVYSMNSERLQRNLETAEEENAVLQESNNQLKQEVEGWAERVSELEEEMRRCEVAHSAMSQDVAIKDDRIMVWLLLMNVDHIRRTTKFKYRHMLAARLICSDSPGSCVQVERIQQKLQIMTEMYQENELKLHRMLTVEEKERHQKEEKLNKADKNIAMAMEELNNYRKRAEEMEEELEKTKQSYHTQISAHEKKAHNNWLAVRSAERELGDIRRENALLRQKLTDTQFKLDSLDKDPYALNNLARPLSPYGPSPLGRPSSETRPFLSPPTLMDGLPGRLSPRGKLSIYLHVASSHSTMLPNEVLWPPHPQGMMLPPRFSPGGPLRPAPNSNAPYGPPMALPPSDGPPLPHQRSLPSPPQSQSPENRPSPEDAI